MYLASLGSMVAGTTAGGREGKDGGEVGGWEWWEDVVLGFLRLLAVLWFVTVVMVPCFVLF